MFNWFKKLVPFYAKPTMEMLEAQQQKNERYYQLKCNEILQACHYANLTGKKPAIILIVREQSQEKYIRAAARVCKTTKVRLNGDDYHVTMLVHRDLS